jgi:hypothetical protein
MFFPMTISAYQNTFLDFIFDSLPTSSQSLFGNAKILAPIDMMELKRIITSIITASGASPALILNRSQPRRLSTFRDRSLYILGAVSILSCIFSRDGFHSHPLYH